MVVVCNTNACIIKERSQIIGLSIHFKKLGKEKRTKLKARREKGNNKDQTEINETEI